MNDERLINALGQVDESYIMESSPENKKNKKIKYYKWAKWGAIAASIIIALGMVTTVEANTGMVSNLLAPLFGGAKTEIVDCIGVPVGVSATADGYTLTADAIIGDRYNVVIVYTLTRDDGQPLPKEVVFSGWNTTISSKKGSGSLIYVGDEEDESKAHYIESWSFDSPIIGRYVTATFSDLKIYMGEEEDVFLAAGPWELEYTLCYKDSTKKVPVKNLVVNDTYDNEYTIKEIKISPIGIYMDFEIDKKKNSDEKMTVSITSEDGTQEKEVEVNRENFTVSLLLKDGTEVKLKGSYGEGSGPLSTTYKGDYQDIFDTPIPLDDMEALIICGTTYPLEIND